MSDLFLPQNGLSGAVGFRPTAVRKEAAPPPPPTQRQQQQQEDEDEVARLPGLPVAQGSVGGESALQDEAEEEGEEEEVAATRDQSFSLSDTAATGALRNRNSEDNKRRDNYTNLLRREIDE